MRRNFLLTSVAMTALVVGIVAADAQQGAPPDRRDQPAARQPSQQPPRARDGARQEQPAARSQGQPAQSQRDRSTTGQSGERQPDQPRAQQPPQAQQERAREQRSTTGQSSERPADPPRAQPDRGDARDPAPAARERTGRTGEDRSRGQARERATTSPPQDRAGSAGSRPGETTRDAPRRGDAQRQDTRQDTTRQDTTRQDTAREPASRADRRDQGTTSGSVRMSEEQRTRVSTRFSATIDRMNVRPLSRTQISVSVGAALPRSVRLYAVPRDIVAIYPQFRGHRFVVVEDEVVIVEPRSQRVVTVLPMGGGGRQAGRALARETTGGAGSTRETIGAAPSSRVNISPQVRQEIRTVVLQQPACRLEQRIDFLLFIPLPRTVEVCELPPQIVSDAPELRRYRYVVRGDEIALIDPADHRIVEVIR
jgi:hypothetical protein